MARLMRMPEVAAGGDRGRAARVVGGRARGVRGRGRARHRRDRQGGRRHRGRGGRRRRPAAGAAGRDRRGRRTDRRPGRPGGDRRRRRRPAGRSSASRPRRRPDPEGAPDQPLSPPVPAALVPETVAASGLTGRASPPSGNGHGRIFASPLARRLARDARLPLEGITGTGPGGRIVRRDVEAATPSSRAGRGRPVVGRRRSPTCRTPRCGGRSRAG